MVPVSRRELLASLMALPTSILPTSIFSEVEIPLFDGRTLRSWKAGENRSSFRLVDGQIVASGPRSHLFYTGREMPSGGFKNFELMAEVLPRPGAESGIYFHTAFQAKGEPRRVSRSRSTTHTVAGTTPTSTTKPAHFVTSATSISLWRKTMNGPSYTSLSMDTECRSC